MKHTAIFFLLTLAACGGDREARVVGQLASDRVELTAEFDERILGFEVDEGDAVEAGALLAVQDDARARARLAAAEAEVGQAAARLGELVRGPREERIAAARARLDSADDELEFRAADYSRVSGIHERGLASPEQLDRAETALEQARAALAARRAELEELLAGTTVEEIEQAEQALELARARRTQAEVDLDRLELRAPVAGLVDSRLFEPGERPPAGRPVMILLTGEQPYARVYIPESLRVRISAGDAATVHVDGLESPLDGTVRWVASEAAFTPYFALTERDRGRLSYVAKIDLEAYPRRLPDGVPVEVEFDGVSRRE